MKKERPGGSSGQEAPGPAALQANERRPDPVKNSRAVLTALSVANKLDPNKPSAKFVTISPTGKI